MIPTFDLTELTRRRFLGAALGAIAAGAVGLPATRAFAQSDDVPTLDEAIAEAVGDKTVEDAGGLIDLDLLCRRKPAAGSRDFPLHKA